MSTEKKVQFITLNGKSAYQYALEGGYTGSEAEFKEKMATELEVAYDYEDLNKKLLAASIKPEVSGTFIHVEDAATLPLLSLDYEGENVTFTMNGKNLFEITEIAAQTLNQECLGLSITKSITISCKCSADLAVSTPVWRIRASYQDGTFSYIMDEELTTVGKGTFQATESNPIIELQFRTSMMTAGKYYDLQTEYGSTATDYEPFTSKTITVASPDELNLNDFVMNSPVTNISNDQNLPMTIQYVADAKTYIDNLAGSLTNAVVSLGGEV